MVHVARSHWCMAHETLYSAPLLKLSAFPLHALRARTCCVWSLNAEPAMLLMQSASRRMVMCACARQEARAEGRDKCTCSEPVCVWCWRVGAEAEASAVAVLRHRWRECACRARSRLPKGSATAARRCSRRSPISCEEDRRMAPTPLQCVGRYCSCA